MDYSLKQTGTTDELPLFSNAFIIKVVVAVGILALLSIAINVFGREMGERLARGGHSSSTKTLAIRIGQDNLRLTANTIRFEEQRHDGPAERADLYLLWPEMTGYSDANNRRFNDITQADKIIFVQLSQSTMSRDMSGRLGPIYSHLFEGNAKQLDFGLSQHKLRSESGYGDEVLLTAPQAGAPDYAVRCVLPAPGTPSSSGDCQRDIHVGRDLTVLYRFSSANLGQWAQIDAAIHRYFNDRLAETALKTSRLN